MTTDFKSKVVLVTGAGSGIGREAARTFARRGGLVYGADLNQKGLTETRSLVLNEGGQCEVVRVDVSVEDEVIALVTRIEQASKRLDVAFNKCGFVRNNRATCSANCSSSMAG